jgi:hypothetical protein
LTVVSDAKIKQGSRSLTSVGYQVRTRAEVPVFFRVGCVFAMIWSETAGGKTLPRHVTHNSDHTISRKVSNCGLEGGTKFVFMSRARSPAESSFKHHCVLFYDGTSPSRPERDDSAEGPWCSNNSADRVPALRSNTVHCGPPDVSLSCSTPKRCILDWDSLCSRLIASSTIPQYPWRTRDSDDGPAQPTHRLP